MSRIELAPDWGTAPFLDPALWGRDPLAQSIWGNPPHFAAETFPWNEPTMHRAQIPAANAIGTARSIAKFYSCLAAGGSPILSDHSVLLGRKTVSDGIEELHGWHRRTGVGFELQTEFLHLGPAEDAFGHGGAGGSKHGAWPGHLVGFSYSMNLMREPTSGDIRAHRLLAALHSCLERQI